MQEGAEWAVEFYLHGDGTAPAEVFLDACPVGARLLEIIEAVRGFPPHKFPPSQMWHAMRGKMSGIYEARTRHQKLLHRLFCILDAKGAAYGLEAPTLAMLGGGTKPIAEAMDSDIYDDILVYRDRYLGSKTRPIKP